VHFHPHIPARLRFLIAFCLVMFIPIVIFMRNDSKQKNEYPHITGKITYRDSILGNLPVRDMGLYRYIKIENYPYPFEIYSDTQSATMDSLKTGDIVTAYFYETDDAKEEKINRVLQFLQKGDKYYFKRTAFKQQLGYVMIGLLLAMMCFFYILYKKGKISY
jgi:hypothetical protein